MYLRSFFGEHGTPHPCAGCVGENLLPFAVRMAFQPVVSSVDRTIFAYEALVRGENGEEAAKVIARVEPHQLYRFDQTCRVCAIVTAARLGITVRLSINISPNAVHNPASCLRMTLAAAACCDFDPRRLVFELTERERMRDTAHVVDIVTDYQKRGFLTAIDDFGAGYAGMGLLADFQPDLVKLDMSLIRAIDTHPVRRTIVAGIAATCTALGCTMLVEGVETAAEYRTLRDMGITLFQGFLFARPALEQLPQVDPALWDALAGDA